MAHLFESAHPVCIYEVRVKLYPFGRQSSTISELRARAIEKGSVFH